MSSPKKAGAALIAAVAASMAILPSAQAAPSGRKAVPAAKPGAAGAADQGATDKARSLSIRVYLAPKGGTAALKDAVAAVSTPGSASYHHYLTPAQYRARFAPSADSVAAVKSFLKGAGLTVTGVEAASRYVSASGSAAAVQSAFATTLHDYVKDGDAFVAPTTAASVPDSVAASVLAVSGLSTQEHGMRPAARYPAAFVNARPCSRFYGEVPASTQADGQTPLPPFGGKTIPYAVCGYTPTQFRGAYEGGSALNGSGQTVAITDAYASPSILGDANTYATRHGDAAFAPGQFEQRNAKKFSVKKLCDPTGWYGEETLDVEAVHGMAQGAKVLYYGAQSCLDSDFADTLDRVVDDNDASIVSNSWGEPEGDETPDDIVASEQAFQQGALQGISFLFSSGDNGDEVANTGTKQADYPASDPYITALGGTATGIDAANGLQFQTGWGTHKWSLADGAWTGDTYLYGSGGGVSKLFGQPDYQRTSGVIPAADSSGRAVPDIAMDGDPTTGMLVGETQQFPKGGPAYGEYRIGGTSLASPLMAGFQALANQRAGRQGFLNPGLYRDARTPQFNDVNAPGPDAGNVRADYVNSVDASQGIVYSVRTFDQDSSLGDDGAVTAGWDEITGIGVPSPAYLASHTSR